MGPSYLRNLIEIKESAYDTRGTYQLVLPNFKTIKYRKECFSCEGAKLWNSLPNSFKECISVKDFKRLTSTWDGPSCGCSHCKMCVLNQL